MIRRLHVTTEKSAGSTSLFGDSRPTNVVIEIQLLCLC